MTRSRDERSQAAGSLARWVNPLLLGPAFVRRDWAIARSYRLAFVIGLFGSFANLMLVYYLGNFIDRSGTSRHGQLSAGYFAFAVLGMALLGVMDAAISSSSSQLGTFQTTGTLESMFTTPTPAWLSVLWGSAYDLMYATASALLYVGLGALLFDLTFHASLGGALLAAGGLVFTALLFSAIGMLLAAVTIVVKRVAGLIGLVVTGTAVLGGVWYPVEVLPEPLQSIARTLPFTWAVDVMRSALLEHELPVAQFLGLAASAAVLLPISCWLLARSVERARRSGTLAQY